MNYYHYHGCDISEGISRNHARKILKEFGDAESVDLCNESDKRVALVRTPGHAFYVLAQDIVYRCNGKLVVEEAGTCIGDEVGVEETYQELFAWDEWGPREVDANGVIVLDDIYKYSDHGETLEFLFAGDLKDFKG